MKVWRFTVKYRSTRRSVLVKISFQSLFYRYDRKYQQDELCKTNYVTDNRYCIY